MHKLHNVSVKRKYLKYFNNIFNIFFSVCASMETLPSIRQITLYGIAAYFMSCGTSANAMSLVTQTSRPIRGKGADVMFGLSALSAGSQLQDQYQEMSP